jgi:hypothetical protein
VPAQHADTATAVLQFASFGNEEAARSAWQQLRDKHRATLAGISAAPERATIEGSRVVWRVRTRPLPAGDGARICRELRRAGTGCLAIGN